MSVFLQKDSRRVRVKKGQSWSAEARYDEPAGWVRVVKEPDDMIVIEVMGRRVCRIGSHTAVLLHAALSAYINSPRPDPWTELLEAFPFGEDEEINGADVVDFINARIG